MTDWLMGKVCSVPFLFCIITSTQTTRLDYFCHLVQNPLHSVCSLSVSRCIKHQTSNIKQKMNNFLWRRLGRRIKRWRTVDSEGILILTLRFIYNVFFTLFSVYCLKCLSALTFSLKLYKKIDHFSFAFAIFMKKKIEYIKSLTN